MRSSFRQSVADGVLDPQDLIKQAQERAGAADTALLEKESAAVADAQAFKVDAGDDVVKQAESLTAQIHGLLEKEPEEQGEPAKQAEPGTDGAKPEGATSSAEPGDGKVATILASGIIDDVLAKGASDALDSGASVNEAGAVSFEGLDIPAINEKVASDMMKLGFGLKRLIKPALGATALTASVGAGAAGGAHLQKRKDIIGMAGYMQADAARDERANRVAFQAGQKSVFDALQRRRVAAAGSQGGM